MLKCLVQFYKYYNNLCVANGVAIYLSDESMDTIILL